MKSLNPMHDGVKLVNCAKCSVVLLGKSMLDWVKSLPIPYRRNVPPMMAGRFRGRPYCAVCLKERKQQCGEK
jgi:hypothetical protein